MVSNLEEIPLFELDLVALPGEIIPLHIFEPRYQRMLKSCVAEADRRQQGFVVAFSGSQSFPEVGTYVRIVQVVEEYEDGRSVIVVQGKKRVELTDKIEDQEFPRVLVKAYEDLPGRTSTVNLYEKVIHSIRHIVQMLGTDDDLQVLDEPCSSYVVAALLGLENSEKQQMLCLRTESERLEFLYGLLQFRIAEVESKASFSGLEEQAKLVH